MADQISRGALSDIFRDPNNAESRHPFPVLQCLQIKPLNSGAPGSERFRVVVSDINHYCQCMLATQANHVVRDSTLKKGHLVRIKGYQANAVKGKNILIILGIEVMEEHGCLEKVGDPQGIEAPAAGGPTVAAPQPQAQSGAGFYGANPPAAVKKEEPSQAMGLPTRGAQSSDRHGNNVIYPIEALSPYAHKWTIKARVTQKSDVRHWHKQSGEGKLFSVNLLDESSEIKATCFNEQVDQYYDMLVEGGVYYISSPCKVGLAKKQFTNLPNDYELTFERDTHIEKAEDTGGVPQMKFDFVALGDLATHEKDTTVDVVGVLKDVGEIFEGEGKASGKKYQRREVHLVDDSNYEARLTVWNQTALQFDVPVESVVAFKGCKVSDFGGRSLSLSNSGSMTVNPDINDAHRLKGWWDANGRNETFANHQGLAGGGTAGAAGGRQADLKTIAQVKDEGLGTEEQAYFTVKATIVYIKQDSFCYPACQSEKCSKKVVLQVDDTWRCESCDKNWEGPLYRYIMSVNVNDHTGQMWLSCFDDVGKVIMDGMSADELMAMVNSGVEEDRKSACFEAANCKRLSFRCRAKMDTYGENPRIRYQVFGATLLDYKLEGRRLADMIKQLSI